MCVTPPQSPRQDLPPLQESLDHSSRSERPPEAGRPVRAYLVGSSGGHLAELMALRVWWTETERTWVTFDTPDAVSLLAEERTIWAYHPTTRNLPNLLRNAILAVRTLRRDRPEIVVTTGAGLAFPYFLVARLFGIKTAYIEVIDRVDSPTLTGRLCHPFTSLFCVQWESQMDVYRDVHLIGPLL